VFLVCVGGVGINWWQWSHQVALRSSPAQKRHLTVQQ